MWASECDAIGKNDQSVSRWVGIGTLLQPSAGSVTGGQGLLREQESQQCKHMGVWVECEFYIFGEEHCDLVFIASEIKYLMICMSFLRYALCDVSSVGYVENDAKVSVLCYYGECLTVERDCR